MALTAFPLTTDKAKVDVVLPVGRHVLELVVVDSAGLQSAPDTVVITVQRQEVPKPTITAIAPAQGQQGTTVAADITGTNLTGASAVTFAGQGITAAIVSATAAGVRVNLTIAATAPAGLQGFSVTTPNGMAQSPSGVSFTVVAVTPKPTITAIAPTQGQQGASVAGEISGANLAGASAVTFAGKGITAAIVSATATSVRVNLTIAATAPTGLQGFSVTTPGGTAQSPSGVGFTVVAQAKLPAIKGIDPSSGEIGELKAVIAGENLLGARAVNFYLPALRPTLGTLLVPPDDTVVAKIMDGGTANTLPIMIFIADRARPGRAPSPWRPRPA